MKPWKKLLAQVAPALATALGGPLAGIATKTIGQAWLGEEGASESDIEAALLGAEPEGLARLREIDAKFKTDMARIGVDLHKIAAEDRSGAREMAAKLGFWPQVVLSVVFIAGYFGVMYMFFVSGETSVHERLVEPLLLLIGVLTAAVPQILNFWFGSSVGSKQKTAYMRNGG